MQTQIDAQTDQGAPALIELSEKLESTLARIRHTVRSSAETSIHKECHEDLEGIRWICSAMRGMALLFNRDRAASLVNQEEQLREIVAAIGESVQRMAESNDGVAEQMKEQKQEIDVIATLAPGEELTRRLLGAVDCLRDTTTDIGVHVNTMDSELVVASSRVVDLENELNETIEKARYDGLTRVYGREALDDRLRQALDLADSNGPWCFAIADIDIFKKVNDQFGHVVGDATLFKLARVIEGVLSEQAVECVFGRYGGDEFGIIVPHSTIVEAGQIAEWTRHSVEAARWAVRDVEYTFINPTISIGVAQYQAGDTMAQLVERADRALYRAKNEGRNRVALARD